MSSFPSDTWRGNKNVQVAKWRGEGLALRGAGAEWRGPQARRGLIPQAPGAPKGTQWALKTSPRAAGRCSHWSWGHGAPACPPRLGCPRQPQTPRAPVPGDPAPIATQSPRSIPGHVTLELRAGGGARGRGGLPPGSLSREASVCRCGPDHPCQARALVPALPLVRPGRCTCVALSPARVGSLEFSR